MLTLESPKAMQISCNPETDSHATLLPETITCSAWNLGCPGNRVEPEGKLLHNTGSPAFTDNEPENQENEKPARMEVPWRGKPSGCLRNQLCQQAQAPAREESCSSTEARLYSRRAVDLWPVLISWELPHPAQSFHPSLHFFPDSALEFDEDHDQSSFLFHPFCSHWVGKCSKIPVAKHAYQALRSSLSNEMLRFICCWHLYPFLPRQPDVRG